MNGTDVDFASIVQGRAKGKDNYRGRIEKARPDFRESQALFVKSIDLDKRQITCLASTGDVDRSDEIIEPEAYRELLPIYMRNPVVITTHLHRLQTGSSSVIGNAVKAWIDQQGLWVVIEFVKGTDLGEEYWLLYSQKKQRALSVGFIPVESEYEEREGRRVLVHTKVELLEISCVPVGSNREALSRSKQKKSAWLVEKKQEREEEKAVRELREQDPNFDKECEEFAETLLAFDGESEMPDDCDFAGAVGEDDEKINFADLVTGRF